jgi:hypothetical protein
MHLTASERLTIAVAVVLAAGAVWAAWLVGAG